MNINAFAEIRFDSKIIPKGMGTISFRTTIIRTGSDREKRNSATPEYLFSGDIGEVLLNAKQTSYVIAFFNARKGKVEGFRYKYWGDYSCTYTPLQLAGSATTQGVVTPLPGDTTNRIYRLQKQYADSGDVTFKTVTKPVENTVKVYFDGNLQSSGYTIDYTQGLCYFSSAPSSKAISWDGEFDLPVWFDVDTMPGVQIFHGDDKHSWCPDNSDWFRFESLPIVELPVSVKPTII